jgi:hypothetical protein
VIWLTANQSCGDRKQFIKFWNGFAMIKAVGYYSQGKGLNLGNGLFTRLPVCHDPRQIGNLGNPTTIIFSVKFNPHDFIL